MRGLPPEVGWVRRRPPGVDEVQAHLLDNYLMIPTVRLAMLNCLGPRIANRAEEIMGAIPQYVYIGPYEDVQVAG